MRLEVKKDLSVNSDRVKAVDFHSKEPWLLTSLYSGQVVIWNYSTQQVVKTIEACDLPVRCARFIESKQWIICAADVCFSFF